MTNKQMQVKCKWDLVRQTIYKKSNKKILKISENKQINIENKNVVGKQFCSKQK